jgi:hypothetical protein
MDIHELKYVNSIISDISVDALSMYFKKKQKNEITIFANFMKICDNIEKINDLQNT